MKKLLILIVGILIGYYGGNYKGLTLDYCLHKHTNFEKQDKCINNFWHPGEPTVNELMKGLKNVKN